MPKGAWQARYQEALLSKKAIAGVLRVSVRTVERWIASGLPTRSAFGAVRFNPHDVSAWLRGAMGIALPVDWWK